MEHLDYNILFRWFVGLNLDDAVWVPTVFSHNRDRLLESEVAQAFLAGVLRQANERGLLSHEHFTVDGTLLEAWASHKSFVAKDESGTVPDDEDPGNPTVNFRDEPRSNATHESRTDPDARLARKSYGTTSKLSYLGSILVDNRFSLPVAAHVTQPGYEAEGDAALEMLTGLDPSPRRRTVGADKGYDRGCFVRDVRQLGFTPHVAPNVPGRRFHSDIDGRTTRHPGYAVSQRKRKQAEEFFGWSKCYGLLRKLHHRGRERVEWMFTFTVAVYGPADGTNGAADPRARRSPDLRETGLVEVTVERERLLDAVRPHHEKRCGIHQADPGAASLEHEVERGLVQLALHPDHIQQR
jgi:hypothetical protein